MTLLLKDQVYRYGEDFHTEQVSISASRLKKWPSWWKRFGLMRGKYDGEPYWLLAIAPLVFRFTFFGFWSGSFDPDF
jgi:hypothetical protein